MRVRRLERVADGDVLIGLRFEAIMIQYRYTLHFTAMVLTVVSPKSVVPNHRYCDSTLDPLVQTR